jgi:hypothetical protein
MAYDHLVPGDAGGFVVGAAASLGLAAVLFGWLVPRWKRTPERAANAGLLCSVLAVVPGVAFLWVGVPLALAGSGIALGLAGRGKRGGRATAAVGIGIGLFVLVAVAYSVGGSDVTG